MLSGSCAFEHIRVGFAEHVRIETECDTCITQVILFGFVAGDAHYDAAGYAGGFLQCAERAACGVGGDVLADVCGGGYDAQMAQGSWGREYVRHFEVVAP